MPADERIKVIFKRVEVRDDGDWCGSGEWFFRIQVDGQTVGNERAQGGERNPIDIRDGDPINLDQSVWFAEVNVRNKTEVPVVFEALDEDVTCNEHMGTVRYTLLKNTAWRQIELTSRLENYTLTWEVQLSVGGVFTRHPATAVFATRRNTAGGVNYSTVTGVRRASRQEICPVWPVPPDASLAPTTRPPPAGVTVVRNGDPKEVIAGSDINIIPNPEVIPLMSDPAPATGTPPALPAGAPPRATAQTAARIETTYYYPDTLNFEDDDPRLEWEANPADRVGFLGGNLGLKVLVYGKTEGDVLLTVRFQGAVFAQYRAVVRPIKQIPFRANILNGTGANKPSTSPEHVPNHIAIANRFLRQVGLELVPDTNVNLTNGAAVTGQAAVYRINNVPANRTRNVHGSHPMSCRLNHRDNVLNIQYIHSIQKNPGSLIFGWAADRPAHPDHPSISDNLIPTPSWMAPTAAMGGGGCGVPPDPNPGGSITMDLLDSSNRPDFPNLAAILITNDNGTPSTDAGARRYGNCIAHELAHVLGLRHRVGAGPDGTIGHPPQQNIMCQGEPPMTRQDFDRIQAQAMRRSPLVPL